MRNSLPFLAALLLFTTTAHAQNWSLGVGTGPFVFGDFVKRSSTVGTETGSTTTTSRLSAATRPGIEADLERDFGRWLGIRAGVAWTYAPLRIKGSGSGGVTFDGGHVGVTTIVLPLVVNLNRGSFRFHLMGGPAYALYHGNARGGGGTGFPIFAGTRGRAGWTAGGGAAWWWSNRFGVEGEISDTVTASPFRVEDIATTGKGIEIPRAENVHTTVGIRYRF
jgi:hypothetical protein